MAQFMPTFAQEDTTTDGISYITDVDDLEEEDLKKDLAHNMAFIFIVDRSGSMSCGNRMPLTI